MTTRMKSFLRTWPGILLQTFALIAVVWAGTGAVAGTVSGIYKAPVEIDSLQAHQARHHDSLQLALDSLGAVAAKTSILDSIHLDLHAAEKRDAFMLSLICNIEGRGPRECKDDGTDSGGAP